MSFIDQIVNYITRPPRQQYHIRRLGSPHFNLASQKTQHTLLCRRQDFILLTAKKEKIEASFYTHQYDNSKCIIYLHANNGSRIEGLDYLKKVLEREYSFCIFDFLGSGNSGGEYVTLGYHEAQDVQNMVNFLVQNKGVKQVYLWGRSMGAVSLLIYSAKAHPAVKAIVLDSPFKDLGKLVKQVASQRTSLPKILFQPLLYFINEQLKNRINVSLDQYKIKRFLSSDSYLSIPALFLVSQKDKLVGSHHGQKLYSRYRCLHKYLKYIENQHNQHRGIKTIEQGLNFFDKHSMNYQSRISLTSLRSSLKEKDGESLKRTMSVRCPSTTTLNSSAKISLSTICSKQSQSSRLVQQQALR